MDNWPDLNRGMSEAQFAQYSMGYKRSISDRISSWLSMEEELKLCSDNVTLYRDIVQGYYWMGRTVGMRQLIKER